MPEFRTYQRQVTPTAQTDYSPQTAAQMDLASPRPVLEATKQLADIGTELATKMREADHVANYAKVSADFDNLNNQFKQQILQDPSNYKTHEANYIKATSEFKNTALSSITDPVSRNSINMALDKSISSGAIDVRNIATNQKIDINTSDILSSADMYYNTGRITEGNALIRQGMQTGLISYTKGQSLIDAKSQEAKVNIAKAAVAADPMNARSVALDPQYGLSAAESVDIIKFGNQMIYDAARMKEFQQDQIDEDIEKNLSQFLLNKDPNGGNAYLRSVSGQLSPDKILKYNSLFESGKFATDMNYFNALFDRTSAGNNTRAEILSTNRIAEEDKAELLRIYYSAHGAGEKKEGGGMVSAKQLFNKQVQFANDYLHSKLISTGPLAQFVHQDEQVALANAKRATYYAALSGQDPVEYANKLVSHMNKQKKLGTRRYGTIVDRASYEATGRMAVRDRKAGKLNDQEWLGIQETLQMAKDTLGL